MDKILVNNKDSLPIGVTLEDIQLALDNGDVPLTNKNLHQYADSVNATIYDAFINYLVMTWRSERTAKSYADKVVEACEQCDIDMMSLFFGCKYTVDDLIYLYSSSGVMAGENRRQRYAPATALRAFEDFVIYEREDQCFLVFKPPKMALFILLSKNESKLFMNTHILFLNTQHVRGEENRYELQTN